MIVAARLVRVNGLSSSTNQRNQTGQGSDRRVEAKRQLIPTSKDTPMRPKRIPTFLITVAGGSTPLSSPRLPEAPAGH